MLLLDSNAFLTPALSYYAFDICGGYWDWILKAAKKGQVASIAPVKRELRQKDDQIRHWIDLHGAKIFLPDSAKIKDCLRQVSVWANNNSFKETAIAQFLNKADYQLVAHALDGGHQIVTLETSEPRRKNKIKIPDAGNAHGVSSISPFEMLRMNKVRL